MWRHPAATRWRWRAEALSWPGRRASPDPSGCCTASSICGAYTANSGHQGNRHPGGERGAGLGLHAAQPSGPPDPGGEHRYRLPELRRQVARARRRPESEIEVVAQGRVCWDHRPAAGLIERVRSLDRAFAWRAERAGIARISRAHQSRSRAEGWRQFLARQAGLADGAGSRPGPARGDTQADALLIEVR